MSSIVLISYLPPALVAQGPLRVDEPPEAGSGDAVIGPPLQPVDRPGPGDKNGQQDREQEG